MGRSVQSSSWSRFSTSCSIVRRKIDSIKKGDQVLTLGGIYGTIAEIGDKSLKLKIADGVVIEVVRSSVNANVTQQEAA